MGVLSCRWQQLTRRVSVAALHFDLDQCFEIKFDDPKLKKARLSLEARVIGLLRSHSKGTAEEGPSCATVSCGSVHS